MAAYLDEHSDTVTSLTELGHIAGLNPFNLLRSFTRILGVSPREYVRARKLERFKAEVRKPSAGTQSARITDAVYEAGFSSSSRLYENVQQEIGMTPGQLRNQGKGLAISYTITDSPLGKMLVATTAKGLCSVAFGDDPTELEAQLTKQFAKADLRRDDALLADAGRAMLDQLKEHPASFALPYDVRATAFQRRVWQALQHVPRGETRSYGDIAREIGQPTAVRAVGRAIATNPLAVIIPCHRVIGSDGGISGYRWGVERKRALLEAERKSAAKHPTGAK